MTTKDETLAQLNNTKSQLTEYLIVNSAQPGTAAFAQLQAVAAKENEVEAQINAILATAFNPSNPAELQNALTALGTATTNLTNLGTALAKIGSVLSIAGTIVTTAGTIVALAT